MKKVFSLIVAFAAVAFISSACNDDENKSDEVKDDPVEKTPVDEEEYTTDVEYYEFNPLVPESTVYAVRAAGKYIKVLPTNEPHLAWLGVNEGKVKFEISLQSGVVSTADVHPVAKNYESKIENGKLTLILSKYDRVSVEINGDISNPLFIFVNPIDEERPSKDDPSVMYFEAGQMYETGTIVLSESCKELYFEPGTYVNGSILGVDLDGVKIHGGGYMTSEGCEGRFSEFYQPFSTALNRCPNSEVKDYTHLFAYGGWSSLYTNCTNSNITNVKSIGIETAPGEKTNNDSMDIIGGVNVHVQHCFLYGHDDCYCLKSQKFYLKGEVDGIYYDDCIGWNVDAGNTFEIGYETNIDITNVSYTNCYAIHSGTSGSDLRRAAFSIHNGAAGTISNVSYENVYVEDAMEFCLYLACLSHSYNIGYDDDGNALEYSPGQITDVTYKNLNVLSVRQNKGYCVIQGYDSSHLVQNVTFNSFYYLGSKVTSLDESIWSIKRNYDNITFQ